MKWRTLPVALVFAVLASPVVPEALSNPPARRVRDAIMAPARTLGLTLIVVETQGPGDLERALASLSRERADGLIVVEDPPIIEQRQLIVDFATRHRLPTMFGGRSNLRA